MRTGEPQQKNLKRTSWANSSAVAAVLLCLSLPSYAQQTEELPLSGPAYTLANEAYSAFQRKDYATTITKVREAIRQRPDVTRLKVLLIQALEASGQKKAAADQVQTFLAETNDPSLRKELERLNRPAGSSGALTYADPAAQAADQAYRAYNSKNWKLAIASAEKAASLAPGNRNYQLLLINSLSAAKNYSRAEQQVNKAISRFGKDWELLRTRGYIRQASGNSEAAIQDFSEALRFAPTNKDRRLALLALADSTNNAKDYQKTLDVLEPLAHENSYDVLTRRALALAGLNRKQEALEALAQADRIATPAQRNTLLSTRIGLLADIGKKKEAQTLFAQARDNEFRNMSDTDLAYLAAHVDDNETASRLFQKLDQQGQLKGKMLIDAAYANKKQFNNQEAIEYLKRATDAHEAGEITLDPQYAFGLRRETADMVRTWGAYSSIIYGSVGSAPGSSFVPLSTGNTTQSIQEIYWRPPVIGYRNGSIFEIFARTFTTLQSDNKGPKGLSTMQGAIGARWKPFPTYNLIFEASRMFPIGKHSRQDVLLRIAFSEGRGTDLRVDVPSWWMWQLYAEIGRYVQTNINIATLEARAGHSFRIDSISRNLVVTPFVAMGASYDSSLATQGALGAGPGLNIRYWFREDKYVAPMSYVDVNVQYRFKIAGDDRAKGVFAGITLAY
ncbi:hypothetical protein WJT86_03830 [Microvirga sp. W0021]|uniref:Bacteriophage N4 adsorption protein A C-terminal domain-containing protein n=1 Tax=Hohaiivirga grylli TaxID=3133970 RepID=A0ABV0BGU8_9HYPH